MDKSLQTEGAMKIAKAVTSQNFSDLPKTVNLSALGKEPSCSHLFIRFAFSQALRCTNRVSGNTDLLILLLFDRRVFKLLQALCNWSRDMYEQVGGVRLVQRLIAK